MPAGRMVAECKQPEMRACRRCDLVVWSAPRRRLAPGASPSFTWYASRAQSPWGLPKSRLAGDLEQRLSVPTQVVDNGLRKAQAAAHLVPDDDGAINLAAPPVADHLDVLVGGADIGGMDWPPGCT